MFTGPNVKTINNRPVALSENVQIAVVSPLDSITPTPQPTTTVSTPTPTQTTTVTPVNSQPTPTPTPTQTTGTSTPFLDVAEWDIVNGQNVWLRSHAPGVEFVVGNTTDFLQVGVGRAPAGQANGSVAWSNVRLTRIETSITRDSGVVGSGSTGGSFNPTPSNPARALGASDSSNPSSIRGKKYKLSGGFGGPVGSYLDVAEWKTENGQNIWLRAHNLNQEFTVGEDTSFIQVGVGINPAQSATGTITWNNVRLMETFGFIDTNAVSSANASGTFTSTPSNSARSLGSYDNNVRGGKFKLEGSVR